MLEGRNGGTVWWLQVSYVEGKTISFTANFDETEYPNDNALN